MPDLTDSEKLDVTRDAVLHLSKMMLSTEERISRLEKNLVLLTEKVLDYVKKDQEYIEELRTQISTKVSKKPFFY